VTRSTTSRGWGLPGFFRVRVREKALLRERSKRRPILIHDALPAGEAAVRVPGGYLVGDRLVSVDARAPSAELNRRALADLPGEVERPPGELRWRPSRILSVR